jgi:signal transduction histidine kinase
MVAYHRSSALHAYVLAVSAVGLCLLVLLASGGGLATVLEQPPIFWALLACLVIVESFPILSSVSGGTQVATTAEAFAFAILLGSGTAAATFALVLGLLVADVLRRVGPERMLFNAGQYTLLMATAGGVYELLGGGGRFSARHLPALAAAALVFFIGNLVLVGVATTFAYGRDFVTDLKKSLRIEARPYAMVFGMAPILLVVAENSIGLLPLLLLPLFAVREALKTAEQADERRIAAEQATAEAKAVAIDKALLAEAEHSLVERLQETDRLKDELLATVSHELRTPLAGVLGALATLTAREGRLSDQQRQELDGLAVRQGERLKAQIEQLLLAARLEQIGQDPVEQPVVDVAKLARQAAAAGGLTHPDHAVILAADLTLPVRAVPEAVLQVLANLLDNAAKYSPDGAPIRLSANRFGPLAVLAVEDTGPGVPRAERDRIFERFTQLDSGATRRAGGVGLGLYIARQLANAQGGELLVGEPTSPGAGARFELRLPLVNQPQEGFLANVASTR